MRFFDDTVVADEQFEGIAGAGTADETNETDEIDDDGDDADVEDDEGDVDDVTGDVQGLLFRAERSLCQKKIECLHFFQSDQGRRQLTQS